MVLQVTTTSPSPHPSRTMSEFVVIGPLLLLLIWLFVQWFSKRLINSKSLLPLPPGPKPLPFIGNLKDMPSSDEWLVATEWGKQYGDLVHVEVLGTHILYVNSLAIARDLFDKRSTVYSSRARTVMLTEIAGWDWMFGFMPYGSVWREHRRAFHQIFNQTASVPFQPYEVNAVRKLLLRLIDAPEEFDDHLLHTITEVIMKVMYGIQIESTSDKFIQIAEAALESLTLGVPGRFLVDSIPILKHIPRWFPGAEFQRIGSIWNRANARLRNEPFEATKKTVEKEIESGEASHCAVSSMLKSGQQFNEELIKNVAAASYTAGTDTTLSVLRSFFMAMIMYPEVQRKAQEQLDLIIGRDRLPEFSDRESLPYVEAVFMECFRWHPQTPLVPHATTEEDEYNGFYIPKGSVVVGNTWAMLHDEKAYPDPSNFKPERYLDQNGSLDSSVQKPFAASFGFGRRVCPGRYMAKDTAFIAIASILATLDISHAIDQVTGLPIPVEEKMILRIVLNPVPFKCSITPRRFRSPAATTSLIRTALESMC